MPPPYVAVARIREAENFPTLAPSQFNERVPELVHPQKAPDPPRYGDVPARKAKIQRYSVLAKRQIRAVMHDGQAGIIRKTEFAQLTSSPRGKSLTWDERANINHRIPEPFGNNYSVFPNSVDAHYRLLMGV